MEGISDSTNATGLKRDISGSGLPVQNDAPMLCISEGVFTGDRHHLLHKLHLI